MENKIFSFYLFIYNLLQTIHLNKVNIQYCYEDKCCIPRATCFAQSFPPPFQISFLLLLLSNSSSWLNCNFELNISSVFAGDSFDSL